ncbi:casein kinase 1, delta [Chaetomium strumarium]|uniref:non-specific serine/threonine protein kinase n=1 Tax=Chaetomium strumarium TaxID=1170767 RepID=A0AAJ0GRL4_9PEZI|nr:casein kinase 1, delta [Chaetomium strumarium]
MDILIADRYRVERKIGAGGFGLVYSGTDLSLGEEVAIKLTFVRNNPEVLRGEKDTYDALDSRVGIPRVRWFGQEYDFYALVIDALGPSLEDLFNYCDRKFSLKTILLIADQAIARIKYIHSKGFLYRDIKPDNFLIGVGRQGNSLYMIDFGLAKELSNAERRKNIEGIPLGGTRQYASINNYNGRGRCLIADDLESFGYIFQGLKVKFATYINYTRGLAFDDKPDYLYLRRLFYRRFRAEGFTYDHVFDWTKKSFKEIQS